MHFATKLLPRRFTHQGWETRMNEDATRLLADLGDAAYGVAADRAWREDVGLIRTADHGHWSRVTLEIGRRLAIIEPTLAGSAQRAAA